MTLRDSRAEYARRMHKVLDYIDRHLDKSLDLITLAEVAHFSAFHFHRLFVAWMGQTLGDYLRHRRLEIAARRLATQPRTPVLNVALSVGFGSAEAFARAFKAKFGYTPTAWRCDTPRRCAAMKHMLVAQMGNPDQLHSNPDQERELNIRNDRTSSSSQRSVPMSIRIINRQPAKVAYLRYTGPYDRGISDFWRDDVFPWLTTHGWLGRSRYGITHNDPGITPPEKCRYDACVEVPTAAPSCLMSEIPGGKYAVAAFHGTPANVVVAWQKLLGEWLPASGMQLDTRPFFEHYPTDARYDAASGAFSCDLYIPLAPL